jgi:type II secretory pathway pseudopilin PulG
MKRYLVALLVVLGVVGFVGVVAVKTGFAEDENAAKAKCSEETLHGTYLFAYDGVDVTGNKQVPFAAAGYDVFDGNGHAKSVFSVNYNGEITRKDSFSGTYTVKADCTGTSYGEFDLFIAPDGSKLTFVQIKPSQQVASGIDLQGTAKRVAP